MMSMTRAFAYCVALCALLVAGCNSTETRTQLTFKITASDSLQSRLATLSVTVRVDGRGDQTQQFQQSQLTGLWPVEIVVIPADGNGSTYPVTLTAAAFDGANVLLVSKTVTANFQPRHDEPVLVALDNLDVDGGPADASSQPGNDASSNPPGNDSGSDQTGNDAGGSTNDAGDAGVGPATCATDDTIKCDDGNPCNGTEKCDASNAGADGKGCVKGADAIACAAGSTCDRTTGMCSTCLVNADGDKDGANSVSCGGTDCDDGDDAVAPGKPELCDGKDNDCNGTIDGTAADASCSASAPTGGTATCVSTRCAQHCNDPTYQIVNNACVAPPTNCPANACLPGGTCNPLTGGAYTCTCSAGYRAGLDQMHCVKQGSATALGFETTCDPTVDSFASMPAATSESISATLYAACGLASIATSVMGTPPTLVRPTPAIAGMTGTTALASTVAPMATSSSLTFAFSALVSTVSFDALAIAEPATLTLTVTTAGTDTVVTTPAPTVNGTTVHYAIALPSISRVVLAYAPVTAPNTPQFYVDQLAFTVPGCGDKVTDTAAGEACDDGNSLQCDGCDNACAVSTASSPGCTP